MKVILSTVMVCAKQKTQINPYLKGMTYGTDTIKKTRVAQSSSPHQR
jgi:hypothetical protein